MADRDPVARVLHQGFQRMVRRGLRGVWLRGALPDGPFVWAANHHTWWDPFLAAVVLGTVGRAGGLVMEQSNLERFRFARRLGVFGTAEPRRGLALLAEGRTLVVYPEGELRPPGPVGELAPGAAWYARRGGVPLCAVATRVVLRGHEAPEAYLSLDEVDVTGPLGDVTARLRATLAQGLSDLDRLGPVADPRAPLPGYQLLVAGRRSWDERIDGWRPWRS